MWLSGGIGCGKTWLLRRLKGSHGLKHIRKISRHSLPSERFCEHWILELDRFPEEVLQSVYREMFRLDSCELLGSYEKTVTAAVTAQTFSSTH
jgi:hypothetical protein